MNTIIPSQQLVLQIEKSESEYMKDRMEAIRDREGNPEGIKIEQIGNALCLYSKTMPWPSFNVVKGITKEDLKHLDEIIEFYRRRGRKAQFEIVPSRVDQSLLAELSDRGFYQSGFHTSTYCIPDELTIGKPETVRIKEIDGEDFITYATIHCRGTGLQDNGIPYVAKNNKVLWNRPGWKLYIAYVSDQPAAVGVMFVKDAIASLTFAATLPEFRGQGLHQLLLKRRMNESFRQNCTLVVGQCSYLSQSHRNMERVGMKVGYTRATWTEK